MAGRFEGKVAVVTGSSSGIGQAIAVRLASEGASIVIDYHSHPEGAQDTQKQIAAKNGGKSVIVQADVSTVAGGKSLIDAAYDQLGSCEILVNNAGIEKGADFWDVTEQDYDAVLDLNLKGAFFITQAFVRRLRDLKKPGRVINISSVHGLRASPYKAAYVAAKHGLEGLSKVIALEGGPQPRGE